MEQHLSMKLGARSAPHRASGLALALALATLAWGGPARAQDLPSSIPHASSAPTCRGVDTEGAARALADGDRAADRAAAATRRHRTDDARRAWAEALAAYDRACAAGTDEALERRAIPLFRLERAVEAATSLDAFLATHPLESLAPPLARRVAANLRAIERAVATVVVTTEPVSAQVTLEGAPAGVGPTVRLRVAPETSVTIRAHADGFEPFRMTSTFGAGGPHAIDARLRALAQTVPEAASATTRAPTPLLVPASPSGSGDQAGSHVLRGPDYGLLAGGLVTAGAGILATVTGILFVLESEARGNVVILGDTEAAGILGGVMLSLTGALTAGSIALFVVFAVSSDDDGTAARCGPSGLGLGCVARF
jgi:hypothetical protein